MKLAQYVAENPEAWALAWQEYEAQFADDFLTAGEHNVIAVFRKLQAARDFKQHIEGIAHGHYPADHGIIEGKPKFHGNKRERAK